MNVDSASECPSSTDAMHMIENTSSCGGADENLLSAGKLSFCAGGTAEECHMQEEDAFQDGNQAASKARGIRVQYVLRCTLLMACAVSLGCLCGSGTPEVDVLELPTSTCIRLHIFASVLALLVGLALLLVIATPLMDMMPLNWPRIDVGAHSVMGMLCLVSSSLLIHLEGIYKKQHPWVTEWTRSLLVVAAAFGYFASGICVILVLQHCCIHHGSDMRLLTAGGRHETTEDSIMMKAIIST